MKGPSTSSLAMLYITVRIFRPQLSLHMKIETRKGLFTLDIHHSRSVSGKVIAVNRWNPLALGGFLGVFVSLYNNIF